MEIQETMANFYYDKDSGRWISGRPVVSPISTVVAPVVPFDDAPTVSLVVNRGENFSGLEEDLINHANSKPIGSQEILKGADRPWAVVPNDKGEREISLHTIITRILEGYEYEAVGLPEKWKEKLYTPENPLEQNASDWGFFVEICEEYGYRIKRDDSGRKFTFVPESDGLDTLANYRVAFQSFGGSLYPLDFLQVEEKDKPVYLIKSGFSINVSSNGTFIPPVRHFIDEKGKSRVVVEVPEALSEFLTTNYEFKEEFFSTQADKYQDGKLEGEEKRLFEAVIGKGQDPSREDIIKFFNSTSPDYNSNNLEDTAYQIYRYEGWESGFTTHGNKYVFPGDWLIIEGTSSNLYFPFQVKGITHRFGHKWSTDYEMIR